MGSIQKFASLEQASIPKILKKEHKHFWVNGKPSLKEGNRCFFGTIANNTYGYLFINNSSAYSLKPSFFVAIECLKKRESSS
jgi:hypothetical protein